MIGYPGPDKLVIGGRGFLRATVTVRGQAGHTGSERAAGNANAAAKAAHLVGILSQHQAPDGVDKGFGLPPRLTVTGIRSGESYSIIPDRCEVDIDVRLTPRFTQLEAEALIRRLMRQADQEWQAEEPSGVTFLESWPAYRLGRSAPVRQALLDAAGRHLPRPPEAKVAGPPNIGNYLAKLGIEATAGLGVAYEGLHGADERIDLATIPAIQATYHEAVLTLLRP
jgi:succinyl-diaminopimelate desuccinylase